MLCGWFPTATSTEIATVRKVNSFPRATAKVATTIWVNSQKLLYGFLLAQYLQRLTRGQAASFFDARSLSQTEQQFMLENPYCEQAVIIAPALLHNPVARQAARTL